MTRETSHRDNIDNWGAATAAEPTWRDGLCSTSSYMFLAVPKISRSGYKAIGYGRGKIKFYPSPEALGLDRRELTKMGFFSCLDRSKESVRYVRYLGDLSQINRLLKTLDRSDWDVAPDNWVVYYRIGAGKPSSRLRHPPADVGFHLPPATPSKDQGGLS